MSQNDTILTNIMFQSANLVQDVTVKKKKKSNVNLFNYYFTVSVTTVILKTLIREMILIDLLT